MKTSLKTKLTTTLTAIILLASFFSLTASAETVKVDIGSFNQEIKKLIVTGNTKVLLVQSYNEYVTMEDTYMDKVSVKQVGNTLTINSNESDPAIVTVYVRELYRIDASGSACVKTTGKFNLKFLQVMLRDDASARVKANTESLYTVINDRADLELIGTTDSHILRSDGVAKLNTTKFAALKTERITAQSAVALNTAAKPSTANK